MSEPCLFLSPIKPGLATIKYRVKLIDGASSATSCYFILNRIGGNKQVVWKYVFGGGSNDGVIETIDTTVYWTFQKDGNWTKDEDNILLGDYDVTIQVGEVGSTTYQWFDGIKLSVIMPQSGPFVPTI